MKKLKVKIRRPLYDEEPNGYMESDKDFVMNNLDLCVEYLEKLCKGKIRTKKIFLKNRQK